MHRSVAFRVVVDAISYIIASSGCVINAYIDDFIVVAPRFQAREQYDWLSELLDTLGLPINPSKKTPPCEALTCLGMVVNISDGTLSIAPDKLQSIYQVCCQVAPKKSLSKKSYRSLIGKLIYIHKCQDFHQHDSFSFQKQLPQIQDTVTSRFFSGTYNGF